MSKPVVCTRPIKTAISSFIGLVGIAVAITVIKGLGVIEIGVARRVIGSMVGVLVVVIGNLLPKLRPLTSFSSDHARAAAERFAGRILVLAGIAYVVSFALLPLEVAGRASSIVGISALVAIAVEWTWFVGRPRFFASEPGEEPAVLSRPAVEKRNLTIWILFALLYVLVAVSGKSVFADERRMSEFATWMIVGFGTAFAILFGVLESRHPQK